MATFIVPGSTKVAKEQHLCVSSIPCDESKINHQECKVKADLLKLWASWDVALSCLSPLEREIILSNRWLCCLWHVNGSSEIIISLMLMWSELCLILNCFTSKAWESQSVVWLRDLSWFLFNHPIASCSSASCSWLWVKCWLLVYEQNCLKIFYLNSKGKGVLCSATVLFPPWGQTTPVLLSQIMQHWCLEESLVEERDKTACQPLEIENKSAELQQKGCSFWILQCWWQNTFLSLNMSFWGSRGGI